MTKRRIVLGISDASGFQYGYEALQLLQDIENMETYLIVSRGAGIAHALETPYTKEEVCKMTGIVHPIGNSAAGTSSGLFKTVGMLVAPCSMRTLATVTHGYSNNLLIHAADVVLKERRSLALMVRETPLNLAHLDNMRCITEMGGITFPPMPTLYLQPQGVDNILTRSVSRALELLGLDVPNLPHWG